MLNRVLYAHRIATADPHTHEVAPAQALVIRAGWGEGEQLADGRWQHALELPWAPTKRAQRRAAALRPQERLAELLGARTRELLCEELALRARLDLDQGRIAHAAVELDAALRAAPGELGAEANPALAPRVDELRALRAGVSAVARAALPGATEATAPETQPAPRTRPTRRRARRGRDPPRARAPGSRAAGAHGPQLRVESSQLLLGDERGRQRELLPAEAAPVRGGQVAMSR